MTSFGWKQWVLKSSKVMCYFLHPLQNNKTMENKNKPAYPSIDPKGGVTWTNSRGETVHEPSISPGLSKREIFAMAAMQGFLSNPSIVSHSKFESSDLTDDVMMTGYCSFAIKYTDELLKQLDQ
jgi:hypothetical protein